MCCTVPVFHDDEVVAFVQAFGHHDDIGGSVPGSMPSHGTSAYQEGLIIPPVRIYRAGQPNEDLIKLMARNSGQTLLEPGTSSLYSWPLTLLKAK